MPSTASSEPSAPALHDGKCLLSRAWIIRWVQVPLAPQHTLCNGCGSPLPWLCATHLPPTTNLLIFVKSNISCFPKERKNCSAVPVLINPICLQELFPHALPVWQRDFPGIQLVRWERWGGSELGDSTSACAGRWFSSRVSWQTDPGMVPRGSAPCQGGTEGVVDATSSAGLSWLTAGGDLPAEPRWHQLLHLLPWWPLGCVSAPWSVSVPWSHPQLPA